MSWLLKLRHWQLFLMIILPAAWVSSSPLKEIINSLGLMILFLWLYAISYYGQGVRSALGLPIMRVSFFQFNFIYCLLYCLFQLYFSNKFEGLATLGTPYILLGLYSALAAFHVFGFTAKTLTSIIYRKEASFSEYIFTSFQLLFFIFGIWGLQPKINHSYTRNTL